MTKEYFIQLRHVNRKTSIYFAWETELHCNSRTKLFFGAYELNFAVKCKNICLTIFHKAHPCESGDVMQYALVVESDETSSDQIR